VLSSASAVATCNGFETGGGRYIRFKVRLGGRALQSYNVEDIDDLHIQSSICLHALGILHSLQVLKSHGTVCCVCLIVKPERFTCD